MKKICQNLDVSMISPGETAGSRSFQVQPRNFSNKPDLDTSFICPILLGHVLLPLVIKGNHDEDSIILAGFHRVTSMRAR